MTRPQSKPASALGPPPPNPNLLKQQQMPAQPPTEDQVKLANEVEKARNALYAAIAQYRSLLAETILPENRTKIQNDERMRVLQTINSTHGQLEQVNVGEGPLALTFAALHAILGLKDEINQLKFQNTVLYKQVKELREPKKNAE